MSFSGPMEDQLAIRALNDSYCDAVFRRDPVAWGANWADDASWNLMGDDIVGRAAIVTLWEGAMAGFGFVAFFAQMGALRVDGDHAEGTVYTHEVLEVGDGSVSRPVGRYDDRYVRRGGQWLFLERRYNFLKG
jgi:ketosteroid isomerase-like protein